MIKSLVHEALDNALANGYGVGDDVEQIWISLADECAGLENYTQEEIEPHIKSWLALRDDKGA